MHPILFQLGPLTLRTYGVMVALGFIAALQIAKVGARLRRLPEAKVQDLVVVLIFAGLFGARLFYVLLNFSYFSAHPGEIFQIWEGGLVFYGGFLVAALVGWVYCAWDTRLGGRAHWSRIAD